MRNLFICLVLIALVLLARSTSVDNLESGACLGLFLFFPVVAAQWFNKILLPSHLGALLAGLAIGVSGLAPSTGLESLQIFAQVAGVYVCLRVGSLLSPYIFLNLRILKTSAIVVGVTFLIISTFMKTLWGLSLTTSVYLGLIGSITAPLFTLLSRTDRKAGQMVSSVTTGISLLLLAAFHMTLDFKGLDVAIYESLAFLIFLEIAYWTLRQIRTEHGIYLFFGILSILLFFVARHSEIPPVFLAVPTGFLLRIREGRRQVDWPGAAQPLSPVVIPFVLAYLAASIVLPLPLMKSVHWQMALTFSAAMFAGKGLAVWLASKFFNMPGRDWLQILPQGLFAVLLLQFSLQQSDEISSSAGIVLAAFLINSVGISLLLPIFHIILEKIKIRRLEALQAP